MLNLTAALKANTAYKLLFQPSHSFNQEHMSLKSKKKLHSQKFTLFTSFILFQKVYFIPQYLLLL